MRTILSARDDSSLRALGDKSLFRDAVLFVLRAQNAVDGVGGAAAGFVVVADLHFAEQPDGGTSRKTFSVLRDIEYKEGVPSRKNRHSLAHRGPLLFSLWAIMSSPP